MAAFLEKRKKIKYYKTKLENNKKKIWDLEFLKAQIQEEREVYRQEYDQVSETCLGLEERIKKLESPDVQVGEGMNIKEETEKAKQALQVSLDRKTKLVEYMKTIDLQMQGVDEPDETGRVVHKKGLDETIDDYHGLNQLLVEFMHRI